MTQVTLLVGGPGAGKTEEIVSRLAAGYRDAAIWKPLLLAPTVRHGDQLRRRLVAKCGVAMGLSVDSLSQFSQTLASDRKNPPRVADSAVAEELLVRVTRRAVESGAASYFKPILASRGLHRLTKAAVFNLVSEGIDAADFRAAARRSGLPALQALAAIYSAYLDALNQRGWIHPAAQPFEAAKAVTEGARLPPIVLVDGFQLFRGGELALLQAIGEAAPLLISMDPQAGDRAGYDFRRLQGIFPQAKLVELEDAKAVPSPIVFGGESGDQEAQLRDVARLIKQKLLEAPELRPSDFAIAFRQFAPHLSLARQIFAEYQLPLDPSSGEPMQSQPLGAWLRRLLRLGMNGWRLADVNAVLSSGFINLSRWNLTGEDVRAFARQSRHENRWRGRSTLLAVAAALENKRAQAGMTRALEDLRSLLEDPAGSLEDWARRWDDSLFGDDPIVDPRHLNRPDVEGGVKLVREMFDELVRVQQALGGGEASFDAFASWLEARMESPSLLLREIGGVFLAPMRALGGLRFHSVFVAGLIEGEFPAPRSSTALLNEKALDALTAAGLQLPPEPGLSEDELWDSAHTRADNALYLWKTRLDSRGRPASGSYYFDLLNPEPVNPPQPSPETASSLRELAIACAAQWRRGDRLRPRGFDAWPVVRASVRVEQRRRSYSNAGRFEGLLDSGLVPKLTGPAAVWSASRMESYRTCAFQFFARYGLGIDELEEELTAADAAIRGSVIHEALEQALTPLGEKGLALDSDTLHDALETLRLEGPKIWNEAPAKWGFGAPATWSFEWPDVLEKLELLLAKEAHFSREFDVARIRGVETPMEAALPLNPPMKITAYIDRLDEGPDGLVVVDYKTGREISKKRVLDADRLQLQLYALLAVGDSDAKRVVTRYAWLDPRIKDWRLDSSDEEDNAVIQNVLPVADAVRQSVAGGDFRVNPQTQPCPAYCASRHVCRVNEFSRWKRWQ